MTICNLLAKSLVINFMELLSSEIGLKSEMQMGLWILGTNNEGRSNALDANIIVLKSQA